MKIQLKDNVFIEGFNDGIAMHNFIVKNQIQSIYYGKTSEIPEEIAKECVDKHPNIFYKDYNVPSHVKIADWTSNWTKITAKESIQSACNQIYCIIYREK